MKKQALAIFLAIIAFAIPCHAVNLSSGSWSTSFNCTSLGTCLDFENHEGSSSLCGKSTSFVAANNNPLGSGNAMGVVVGDGTNSYTYTGGFSWSQPASELWIRFYIKYESGFSWNSLLYDKLIYLYSSQFSNQGAISPVFEFFDDNTLRLAQLSGGAVIDDNNVGWHYMMGGNAGDGKWHVMEVYIKTNTSGSNGVYRAWIDGVRVANHTNVNFGQASFYWFILYSNQRSPANTGGCKQVFLDDVAIYTTTPPNRDANGYPFIGPINGSGGTAPPETEPEPEPEPEPTPSEVLFEEKFENASLTSRGWYDNTSPVFTTVEAAPGSTRSIEYRFNSGATNPVNGGAMRKKFTASDSVYLSYYVKYSSNWVGSQQSYHPHEFYFLTNKSGDWSGLAYTPMTLYVEQNQRAPMVAFQDSVSIDTARIGQDLTTVTENRALAGCNGDSDGYGNGSCYQSGGFYYNGKTWKANGTAIARGSWQKVEAYIRLNSILNGKAVADGIIQYWLNGQAVMEQRNVMLRTAQNADMKFNQFVIAPWIGDGSPIAQTFWVDNLVVATAKPGSSTEPLPSPTGLHLVTPVQ